ncbi:MAG: sn-glycerol-3-phosphate ABC transporter ATP-binding protein UgpC [Devosia sp.]|nr:sn-glycerol-3-phosphate ABC transporter ATP-binding protein UgpC [Devosia sp.]
MARLALKGVVKRFGDTEVIKSVDLEVEDGEFVVFVGPSGCGKSTILRMLAGLEQVSGGTIEIDGRNVTGMLPLERGVAMVFQSYALYPHMTVEDNIGFGLKIAGQSRAQRRPKVLEAARVLQLEPYLGRKPKQLSGGQRQRVAIGRAIVKQPKIFLFDEPLSNLDAELRVQMRLEIARLHNDLKATMIYVTHDQVEAMTLADKIVVLRDGRVEQVGRPIELYEKPANLFVAGFIGSPKMNFLKVEARAEALFVPALGANLGGIAVRPDAVTVGIRPEHIAIAADGPFSGTVKVVEQLGSVSYLHAETAAGDVVTIEQRRLTALRPGAPIRFGIEIEHVHLFNSGGQRL